LFYFVRIYTEQHSACLANAMTLAIARSLFTLRSINRRCICNYSRITKGYPIFTGSTWNKNE